MLSLAVMAHPKRAAFIPELQDRLDRTAEVVWDERNDRWDTGRRAMLAYDPAASHHLVVQDDAIVCRDLAAGVEQALDHAPPEAPLGLYLGRVRPYREMVQSAVDRAAGASWIVMGQLHWGVSVVMPTKHIEAMVAWCDGQTIPNYDRRMSRWLEEQGIETWYPWPSLVDHRHSPSMVPGRGHANRRAHRFIGVGASALGLDYSGAVLRLPKPDSYRPGGFPMLFRCTKHDNLYIPTVNVRFEGGYAEVTNQAAAQYLNGAFMRRRGVRMATVEEEAAWRGTEPTDEDVDESDQATGAEDSEPRSVEDDSDETVPDAAEERQAEAQSEPSENESDEPTAGPDPVPDGTAADVLAWVGDAPNRARAALDAENERDRPRTTVVGKLETLTRAE